MTDQAQATTTETTAGQGETPAAPLTATDVAKIVEASLAGFTSKINGEMAGLRKKLGAPAADAPAAAPRTATIEDIAASRELGRLEAQLGDAVISALGEDYASLSIVEQARTLRLLTKLPKAETADASASRGETPAINPKNPRGEAPRPRDGVPRPKTQREYLAMKPEQRALLKADPTFDGSQLPY